MRIQFLLMGVTMTLLGVAQFASSSCLLSTPFGGAFLVPATATAPLGQSFLACNDGVVTNVAVDIGPSTATQVTLGLGPGTDVLTPTYQLTQPFPAGSRIRYVTSFPVVAGQRYALSLTPNQGVLYLSQVSGAGYSDGTEIAVENGVAVEKNSDIVFAVTISDPPVPTRAVTWGTIKSTYR